MTVIATRGGDVTLRDASVGAILAAEGLTRGGLGGTAVTGRSMRGLPAADLAIRIASQAVAKRKRLIVWRGQPPRRKQVTSTWQARFFNGAPNDRLESWFLVFEQTEASLTARNNAFWRKVTDAIGRVVSVYVIHPDCVEGRWNKERGHAEYRIAESGGWGSWLGPDEILHFRVGYPEPGAVIAPSPVQNFKTALGAALSKAQFEGNLYDRGVMQSLAVTFPQGVTAQQARRFREMMASEHGGIDKSAGTRVFGGGAQVTTIGLSLADAQFVEGMNFDVEQVGRMLGVTSSLLGMTGGSGSRTQVTPEHEEDRWWRYGLEPRLCRIEEAVYADPSFFGAASRDYPEFATQRLRADRATEVSSIVSLKQAGIITANTAASELGYEDLGPEGDIVQLTPVGGAPNPDKTTNPAQEDA